MNRFFKSFLTETNNENAEIREGDGALFQGCLSMYQVTNDMFYNDYILTNADRLVENKGKIKGYANGNFTEENMNFGSTLIWLYEQTGEEKYKLGVDAFRDKVREFKLEWNDTMETDAVLHNMEQIYCVQPFFMEYETKFENKECYLDIIAQFKNARQYLFNSNEALIHLDNDEAKPKNIGIYGEDSSACETMAKYLMALIDTMDKMSIEIFEYYKLLEGYFKEALRVILPFQDKESGLFYQQITNEKTTENVIDKKGSLMIAYAVMKACQMKVLLSEKYYGIAEQILESLSVEFHETYRNLNGSTKKDELWNNRRMIGILMMTYSQYMIGNKTKNIKELGCCYEQ